MNRLISVIIPSHNSAGTLQKCLESVCGSDYPNFEVILVDDCSVDNSAEIADRFPIIFTRLEEHGGPAKARNAGAEISRGEILFFTDSDCVVSKGILARINTLFEMNSNSVMGGTYTPKAFDDTFFSTFQSIFINYFETKKNIPDYIAGHCMIISRDIFMQNGGFSATMKPILQDVEFSHRLQKAGYGLLMFPDLLVSHIFNFGLLKSLKNAFRRSMYWTIYSISNRDLLRDSGTASVQLKISGIALIFALAMMLLYIASGGLVYPIAALSALALSLFISRGLIMAFYRNKGACFAFYGALYYALIYPLPILAGALTGLGRRLFSGR